MTTRGWERDRRGSALPVSAVRAGHRGSFVEYDHARPIVSSRISIGPDCPHGSWAAGPNADNPDVHESAIRRRHRRRSARRVGPPAAFTSANACRGGARATTLHQTVIEATPFDNPPSH